MHGIVQKPLLRGARLGDVDERADNAHHFAIRPDNRPRTHAKPGVMPVGAAQPKFLVYATAALFEHRIKRGTIEKSAQRDG